MCGLKVFINRCNLTSKRIRLGLRFQKVRFKITILKCAIEKLIFKNVVKRLQNRKLTFKILRFQKNTILLAISNRNF